MNPAGTLAYVTNFMGSSVSVIDTSTNLVTATIRLGRLSFPRGVAVSPAGTFVYVADGQTSSVSVIDTATNLVTSTIPVGFSPTGVAVNPTGTLAYVTNSGGGSNDLGSISVIVL